MSRMPVLAAVAALTMFVFGMPGAGPVSAASKAPVDLDQDVNVVGTKDVSKKSKATINEKLADFSFSPTFVKAKAGEKITFKVKNTGGASHTFTSDELSVDEQVSPGKSVKFTVTVPSTGAVFQFHCDFHESSGMAGAVYTKTGASASSNGSATQSGSGSGDSGSGDSGSSGSGSSGSGSSGSGSSGSGGVPGY